MVSRAHVLAGRVPPKYSETGVLIAPVLQITESTLFEHQLRLAAERHRPLSEEEIARLYPEERPAPAPSPSSSD